MQNLRFLFIFCFVTLTTYSFSQNIMHGTVTDTLGRPLPGATVGIPELGIGAVADTAGNYSIADLPEKQLTVSIHYLGYQSQLIQVYISGSIKVDITLKESHIEGREVVITGNSASEEKRNTPATLDILTRDKLLSSGSTNIIGALTQIPNVNQISTGAGVSKPVIRGLGFNRVLVVHDGIRQEGQQWGEEHGVEIDEESVSRAEIWKGPAGLQYGSDALAGVIGLQSGPSIETNSLKMEILSGWYSNNAQKLFSVFTGLNKNGYTASVRGTFRDAGDYQNAYDGKVFNSGWQEYNINGMLGVNKKWGYSKLLVSSFNQKLQLPEGERDSLTGAFLQDARPFQWINHFKVTSDNYFILGNNSLNLKLSFQENNRREYEDANTDPAMFMKLRTYILDARWRMEKNWVFGANTTVQDHQNKADEALIPDYNSTSAGAYAFYLHNFNKITLSGGARIDVQDIKTQTLIDGADNVRFQGFERNFFNYSASLGIAYALSPKWTLKANVSRGFRLPSVVELSANGAHEGTFRYEYGNPDLKPETNIQGDLSIEYSSDHVTLNSSVFYNLIDPFIYLSKLQGFRGGDSLVNVDGRNLQAFHYVQSKAQLYGGEFMLDIHPHPLDWLHLEQSFGFVIGQQLNGSGEYLPFIPAPRYKAEIKAEWPQMGKSLLKRLYIKGGVLWSLPQDNIYTLYNTETATPAYVLLNMSAGCSFENKKGKSLATLILNLENAFDTPYQDHLNRLKYAPENLVTGRTGIYNMGRNFSVKLLIPLSWKV